MMSGVPKILVSSVSDVPSATDHDASVAVRYRDCESGPPNCLPRSRYPRSDFHPLRCHSSVNSVVLDSTTLLHISLFKVTEISI